HLHVGQRRIGKFTGEHRRTAHPHLAAGDAFARGEHRPRRQHGVTFHRAAIHHNRAQSDKGAVLQYTAVDHCHVPNQHVIADDRGKAIRALRFGAVAMNHGAVLDIAACADDNAVGVAAYHAIIPDAAVCADLDIANDPTTGRDKGAGMDAGGFAVKRCNGDVGVGHVCAFLERKDGPSTGSGRTDFL
ncbi:MAG: hypothetical protein RLY97_2051, partial [Pseudomonadota bacterium]